MLYLLVNCNDNFNPSVDTLLIDCVFPIVHPENLYDRKCKFVRDSRESEDLSKLTSQDLYQKQFTITEASTMHVKRFRVIHSRESFIRFTSIAHHHEERSYGTALLNAPPITRSRNESNMMHVDTYKGICSRSFHFTRINPLSLELFIFADVCITTMQLTRANFTRATECLYSFLITGSVYMSFSSRYICSRSFTRDPRSC